MVLIISEGIDQTTHEVIDWLIYKKKKYLVLNAEFFLNSAFIKLSNNATKILLHFNNTKEEVDLSLVTSLWYRKGDINIDIKSLLPDFPKELQKDVFLHLSNEWNTFKNFVFEIAQDKRVLGNYFTKVKSKLGYLKYAKDCGLLIPDTFVINSKEMLLEIQKNYTGIITKSIQEIFNIVYGKESLYTYTSMISDEQINSMPDTFFPSLVQNKIDKKYELRIFFMQTSLYAMAIFSQNDEKTKIDFRNYNYEKPNRTVPYKLPNDIERKIISFIECTQLNTGSIDMILTSENEYIFLEVNQAGQFGFVSADCNYYLEKKVAAYLV
ncbi:MAG: grasp-with-spasm system ATP-grasp peptide maturase [Bacteroidia bacterium]